MSEKKKVDVDVEIEEILSDVSPKKETEEHSKDLENAEEVECEAELVGSEISTDLVDESSESNDSLLVAIRSKEDDSSLYNIVLEELAKEAHSLKSLKNTAPNKDFASKAILSEKRTLTLEKTAKMIAQRNKELRDKAGGRIDFHSENFKRVLELMTNIIVEAVRETGMHKASEDRFFIKLQHKLTGFEEMAEQAYKGKNKSESARNASSFNKTRP